jgi:hypothetical protein
MRKLLLILLLMPVFCFGQVTIWLDGKRTTVDTTEFVEYDHWVDTANVKSMMIVQSKITGVKYFGTDGKWVTMISDTIPIIYLYSDTSNYQVEIEKMISVTPKEKWKDIPPTVRDYSCKWDFGYVVYEMYNRNRIVLDKNKQPLKKKYVVWFYKEI